MIMVKSKRGASWHLLPLPGLLGNSFPIVLTTREIFKRYLRYGPLSDKNLPGRRAVLRTLAYAGPGPVRWTSPVFKKMQLPKKTDLESTRFQ
ncbi:hypothetical protein K445DRAFT_312988 [Daldinia sp. EC12]|nr:hypothetical protein K445DRAFT_312988 [Daldinia sp. EC12]